MLSENLDNFNIVKKETNYPFLEYFKFPFEKPEYNILERLINKVSRMVNKKNSIVKTPKQPDIAFLYPNQIDTIQVNGLKKVNWIPDFQEEHLSQFFSEEEIKTRKYNQKEIYSNGDIVVLSSQDSENDFKKLYPKAKAKTVVLNFAVTHPDFSYIKPKKIFKKYNISDSYFFLPNQFWAHKNHLVVLKALKILKDEGIDVLVVFSGNENDYRNKDYVANLKSFVDLNNLENNVNFLGFIPRDEQLFLMKHAKAVIQPSYFEGWSTVVEDIKAINNFVLLSNIEVHIEQMKDNRDFFYPNDPAELASLIKKYTKQETKIKNIDYTLNKIKFSNEFIKLVEQATI